MRDLNLMRRFPAAGVTLFLSLLLVVLLGGVAYSGRANSERTKAQSSTGNGPRQPVVVELFTSEGCSSCPPADALLQKFEEQQPIAGVEILALEEHVDYWNHIGWVDPFSSSQWSERQAEYVALLNDDPFTPELVVDGQKQLSGNNPSGAKAAIEAAARTAKTQVAVTAQTDANRSQNVAVSVSRLAGTTSGDVAEVWLAITEDELHSSVSHGENAGRVLRHVATLRSLRKIGVADATAASSSFSGNEVVKFDARWNRANLHVVVFVQEKASRKILGAASARVQANGAARGDGSLAWDR